MPVARVCSYCKKTFLTSTYGLIKHIDTECLVRKKIKTPVKKKPQTKSFAKDQKFNSHRFLHNGHSI